MRHQLVLAAAATFLLAASSAAAQENFIHEIRGGVLIHDVDFIGAGSDEGGVAFNGELAFGSNWDLLGGRLRPVVGASLTTGDRINQGYADLRWEFSPSPLFFAIGLGASVNDSDLDRGRGNADLGSHLLFHIPAEVGYQFTPTNRISLYYEHVSNAWLAEPNPGMDNIGLRLAHRF